MTVESIDTQLETALNPATFSVLEYVKEPTVAKHTHDVYRDLDAARELLDLREARLTELDYRAAAKQTGGGSTLGLGESDDETEYDERINELVERLDKTKITFHLKSIPPSLEKAIKRSYIAKADKDATAEERSKYEDRMYSDIFSRTIVKVVRGDGAEDTSEWTPDKLKALQEEIDDEQMKALLNALAGMVYVGKIFEEALTVDF